MCKNETLSIFWDSSDEEEGGQRSNRSKPQAVKVKETLYIYGERHPSFSREYLLSISFSRLLLQRPHDLV